MTTTTTPATDDISTSFSVSMLLAAIAFILSERTKQRAEDLKLLVFAMDPARRTKRLVEVYITSEGLSWRFLRNAERRQHHRFFPGKG